MSQLLDSDARILLTGASGLLGRAVMRRLQEKFANVLGLCNSRQLPGLTQCDLTSAGDVDRLVRDFRPTAIVHCAAERRPDVVASRPEAARELNEGCTRRLAELADAVGAKMLFISTDYVFDGESPPYGESAAIGPLNAYGRSKANGEAATLQWPGHAVLRVPLLYGEVEDVSESAATHLLTLVRAGAACGVDDWAARFPTHCDDVAMVICDLVARGDFKGIYHWSGEECFTKFAMARAIGRALGLSVEHLTPMRRPDPAAAVDRPRDSRLSCDRLLQLGICHRRRFEPAVRDCLAKFV